MTLRVLLRQNRTRIFTLLAGAASVVACFSAVGVPADAMGEPSTPISAPANDPQIQNLLGRFSKAHVRGGGRFLYSYENSNRSFLYDQALAVLAFVHADRRSAAEDILNGLAHLQTPEGSWAFQYETESGSIIPAEEKLSPAGAVAWVAMAIEAYELKYSADRSGKFQPVLEKTLKYLSSQRVKVEWKGTVSHPVAFSPTRGNIVSFEHNLDAYAVFANAPHNLPLAKENAESAASIRTFLESMWTSNRFNAGFDVEQSEPNLDEYYLDTQSWGILALGLSGSQGQDFRQGLATNCSEFQASEPVSGFVFTHARNRAPASASPVWTEGSLGMMLAMKVSRIQNCDGKKLSDFEASMDQLTHKDGGVPYATESSDPDFSSSSSVAGTAWKYFFRKGFNPFHPSFD
jgi:hypothetical protein